MIVVTGGAGFVGSVFLRRLNQENIDNIIVVDELQNSSKWQNLSKASFYKYIHKDQFLDHIDKSGMKIDGVVHLGADTDTTQTDCDYLFRNNVDYSQSLFEYCTREGVPFVYASSAAVYGDGSQGFDDNPEKVSSYLPLNPYGFSKKIVDVWAQKQTKAPPCWLGLRFFNVYGPNEYHKGKMKSLVPQAFEQIKETGSLKLFKSYLADYAHGEQSRDFIYVKDIADVLFYLLEGALTKKEKFTSGVYNLGTGTSRTFKDLGSAVFKALDVKDNFQWIDMPSNLKDQYQYYTEAQMERFRSATGYDRAFTSLEEGVSDYVTHYLNGKNPYF